MAISTYSELQTEIADWLHRTDLTAKIPTFIQLAENRINRTSSVLLNREIEDESLVATPGSKYIALPSGFIEARKLWLSYYIPREPLRYLPPEQMNEMISTGSPSYWTIDGANGIMLDSKADLAYTFVFRYIGKLSLSDITPTNWLLTNNPDVYLYASLMEAAAYIRDTESLNIWLQAYNLAITEVLNKDHRTRANSTLSTELGGDVTSNIFEG